MGGGDARNCVPIYCFPGTCTQEAGCTWTSRLRDAGYGINCRQQFILLHQMPTKDQQHFVTQFHILLVMNMMKTTIQGTPLLKEKNPLSKLLHSVGFPCIRINLFLLSSARLITARELWFSSFSRRYFIWYQCQSDFGYFNAEEKRFYNIQGQVFGGPLQSDCWNLWAQLVCGCKTLYILM